MIYPQLLLDVHQELIVDLFAGGGGASQGIEAALGRQVDIAINHDPDAVSLHEVNHPQTRHFVSDVFEVDPKTATGGRPVGLLWASPDCTDHSTAKGGKPIRTKKRRALAWVVTRWAGQVRPRVICLENVPEFVGWGPLVGKPGEYRRCPKRAGRTFRAFVRSLEQLGYAVEWRELRACDYGAPTIRKRLFLIARCDGKPIVWPERTHGTRRRPHRSAAECIDWSIPMCSIFATKEEARAWAKLHGVGTPKRPLADATMRRIARGIVRFVLEDPQPFIVGVGGRQGQSPERGIRQPYQTVTTKADSALVVPTLVQTGYGEREGQAPRSLDLHQPLGTIVATGNKHALVAAYLAKHFTGVDGARLHAPMPTVTTVDHNAVVTAHLMNYHAERRDGEVRGAALRDPLPTIDTANRHALVYAFLQKYYGQGIGSSMNEPMGAVTTKDRMGLVTVTVDGGEYAIADIAMRMLVPRELFNAQGFPPEYVIDRGADGRKLSGKVQVRLAGNSVSPPNAAAIVRANVPEMIARDEAKRIA
ncbi:MAG TPA: DNA cytosine methyltransferase [Longimicrobiaceae bacterium]